MDDPDTILQEAEYNLKAAYAGYKQFKSKEGEMKIIGLRNAVTFGRSVTFVLQKLEGKVDGDFEEWYQERQEVLKEDDVAQKMVDLRNRIEHGADDADIGTYAEIDHLNTEDLRRMMPPWADSFFISDQYGGNGFEVELPNGETKKFYVELPEELAVETGLYITNDDSSEPFSGITDAEEDLKYYLKVLSEIVADAKEKFGSE